MLFLEVFLKSSRLVRWSAVLVLSIAVAALLSGSSGHFTRAQGITSQATTQATAAPTSPANCPVEATATVIATDGGLAALPATLAFTTVPTTQPGIDATSEATEAANSPLHFVSITPTDIRFNPSADKPIALVTVYSLIFQNRLGASLHIEKPQFQLAIDGVPWGALVSTDFQTGEMQGNATQGIVLQNLTIIAKTTLPQQAILECLKTHQPVDLILTGTLDAYPNGTKQSVAVTLISRQVVLRERQAAQ